ncbi:hypothetical protein FRC06_002376 [Ceratobasidium sp. 370]|nr:hypothetical protein FRC06_002376 [Ceratobasidium sp. 370]
MAYEFFLVCHVVLVAMYLIFGIFHVPEVKFRFWPALAIWGLDRTLRALRLIVLNKLWLNIFPMGKTINNATIERVSHDTVRLTVRRNFKWTSGQHAFILAPSVARFPFEAHPFTIASSYATGTKPQASNEQDLVFIIRTRDGFTKRLLEASETRQSIPVYVDGPYGAPPNLSHYSTCVFFAGGSGISYTLPLLIDLVRQARIGSAVAQRVLFVWTIRDRSHIDWISHLLHEALQDCPPTILLEIRIHVTQPTVPVLALTRGGTPPEAATPIEEKPSSFRDKDESTPSLESFQSVKIFNGRPNIATLLDEELGSALGRVSVDVSGPASLASAVRSALVACGAAKPSAVLRGTPRATLHVEAGLLYSATFSFVMSFELPYAESLFQLGLEEPTSAEFLEHPDRRITAAFFLGCTFITCLQYLALAALRHPFAGRLARSILRRPIPATIAERQLRATADTEGNIVQNWLRETHLPPATKKSDRPEGTRHLSVVLTTSFAIGILVQLLSFLDFESAQHDVLCFVVIAWAGISISCAKLAGLLRISFDLQRLEIGFREKLAIWAVLLLSFGAILAHATISVGAAIDITEIPGLTLCYRRHFALTSFLISGMNIALEIYFTARMFFLLVPQSLDFHHKVETMMDIRMARIASMLCLELLTFIPAAIPVGTLAEFVPFSLGTLLVLAAFNHRPAQPSETEARGVPALASYRTSVITFPTGNGRDDEPIIQAIEAPKKSDTLLSAPPSPALAPTPGPAPASVRAPRRKSSIASHVTYDSEAEARSVHGAVVSLAFKSGDIEPVPAIPHGLFQPRLIGSPKLVTQSPKVTPKSSLSRGGTQVHGDTTVPPSPRGSLLPKPLSGPKPEEIALSAPKLKLTISGAPTSRKFDSPVGTERTDSVVYGSDIIRRPTLQKPVPVRRTASASTMGAASHGTTSLYTGPDLRYVSMGSHSASFVARDYSAEPPRNTGFYRTSILNPPNGPRSEVASRQSTRQGDSEPRPLSSISFEPWVKEHDFTAGGH